MRQAFFTSIDEAAAFAQVAASRGLDAYHACAVFKNDTSRRQTNAAGAKAFWLDIDVGPKKSYPDARTALAALLTFCRATILPIPTIIHSGGGWHAYWVLEEFLPADAWLACAEALKGLCVRHGLAADPAITSDIARILRPVGTQNFKRETPAPVTLNHSGETVSIRQLIPALQPRLGPQVDNSKFAAKPVHNEEPAYAQRAVQNCRQLAHFRDTEGRIPEPLWYAGLCVLAHCQDGDAYAHEWSKGDERYIYEDTAKKLEQARRASGPTTCDKFQSLNPQACAGCPFAGKITSPIQLGRGDDAPKVTSFAEAEIPAPPSPFRRIASGALQVPVENEETGVPDWVTVYKAPLFLENIREHEQTGHTTLILKHWLPHEGWLEVALPWNDRSQKTVINALAAQKINVHQANERQLLWFLILSIDEFQLHRKTAMEYAQFGWRNDFREFVLGTELYRAGDKPLLIGVTPELHTRAKQMKPYGTFEGWRAAVQPLFVYEQQALMVVAGFASVLMRFVQELTGVIVAAVSQEPRLGKTMGLIAARTIWGDDNCIDIATNDTANSRFKMLAVLNGLPATWDDMRKSNDPEIIKQFVLSFSQGRDKNRLDKTGALRTNASGWASILLATSNISIAELVGHDGETAQQARILEYRFQPMPGMKFSDGQGYERAMRQNRGTAGRKFVEALMLPGMVEWLKQAVPEYVREFEKTLGRSDASFYASFLGCVKAASIILNRCGLLEFSVDRLIKFAIESAEEMGRMMEENRTNATDVVTTFINDNWEYALVVQEEWKPKQNVTVLKHPNRKLFIRYEMKPERIYIDRRAFKEWCRPRNIMFRDACDTLTKKRIMLEQKRRINLGAGTPMSGAGQAQCLEIDAGHPDLGNIRVIDEIKDVPVGPTRGIKRVLIPGKFQEVAK